MRRWIANYETQFSFEELKEKLGVKNNRTKRNNKTIKEVIEDVNGILKTFDLESEVIKNGAF